MSKKNFRLPGCFVKTSKVDDVIRRENALRNFYTKVGVPESMVPSDVVKIRKVVYDNPNTVVVWDDDTVTKCKCSDQDTYDGEKGFLICVLKKLCGSQEVINCINFWTPAPTLEIKELKRQEITIKDVRNTFKSVNSVKDTFND